METNSIVKPVRKRGARNQEFLEEAGDASSDFGRAVLGHEDGGDAAHATDAQARDHSASVDHADVVVRSGLDRSPKHEDQSEALE